jgi:inhibitor of KinA sporulation pathway (predicted exonuclease)
MIHIFVDYEMNEIAHSYKVERTVCKREIIEIGAVMLDENYREIEQFSSYVKPEYGSITPYYTSLTGITNDMVANSPTFAPAMQHFYRWIDNRECTIYSWSDSDSKQLQKEAQLKDAMDEQLEKLLQNWVDFQKVFGKMLGIEKKIALKDAIGAIGEKFKGRQHSALCDAQNTAEIFELSQDKPRFNEVMRPIIDLFKPKNTMTFRLGDLFADAFSELSQENE